MFTIRVFISTITLGIIFSDIILYMFFNIQISPYELDFLHLTYRMTFELFRVGFLFFNDFVCDHLTIADLTIFFDIIDDLKNGFK